MIRLVASDLDGTLLPAGAHTVSAGLLDAIRALRQKDILFCAASGRQYASLRRALAGVADDILYCCDNGAVVYQGGRILAKTPLPEADSRQLVAQLLAQPGCEVLISGADTSYVIPKTDGFLSFVRDELGNNTVAVGDISEISEEIVKIAVCCDRPAGEYAALFAPVWDRHLTVTVAGKHWLDFTLAHKGTALAQIAAALGIPVRETVVFGDNFNDIPMFRFAGESYAMADAPDEVKAAADQICGDLERTLRELGER